MKTSLPGAPGGDGALPARRDWLGALRRWLSPRLRRLADEEAGREAEEYVREMTGPLDAMTLRREDLPSSGKVIQRIYVGEQPWPAATPPEPEPEPEPAARLREPGGPPTIVMEVLRPAIERDLGRYLAQMPRYGG